MQKLAWERHGFRAANFAGTDSISRFGVAGTLDQIIVETIGTLIDGITIGGDSIVEKLVAANSQRQRRAVRLPHTGKPAGIRRP